MMNLFGERRFGIMVGIVSRLARVACIAGRGLYGADIDDLLGMSDMVFDTTEKRIYPMRHICVRLELEGRSVVVDRIPTNRIHLICSIRNASRGAYASAGEPGKLLQEVKWLRASPPGLAGVDESLRNLLDDECLV